MCYVHNTLRLHKNVLLCSHDLWTGSPNKNENALHYSKKKKKFFFENFNILFYFASQNYMKKGGGADIYKVVPTSCRVVYWYMAIGQWPPPCSCIKSSHFQIFRMTRMHRRRNDFSVKTFNLAGLNFCILLGA